MEPPTQHAPESSKRSLLPPALSSALAKLVALLDGLAEWTGRFIALLTLALVLVTFIVVVLRYWFNQGSIMLQESILYLHALIFLLGAAYTLKRDGHVRVDVFYREMSPRAKAWVDLCGTLLFLLPMALFMFFFSLGYVSNSWAVFEGSPEARGIPAVYLLKSAILVMAVLLFLQGVAELLRNGLQLCGAGAPQSTSQEQ